MVLVIINRVMSVYRMIMIYVILYLVMKGVLMMGVCWLMMMRNVMWVMMRLVLVMV